MEEFGELMMAVVLVVQGDGSEEGVGFWWLLGVNTGDSGVALGS